MISDEGIRLEGSPFVPNVNTVYILYLHYYPLNVSKLNDFYCISHKLEMHLWLSNIYNRVVTTNIHDLNQPFMIYFCDCI